MVARAVVPVTGFALVAFAFNSIITRHLVAGSSLDPASVTAIRFAAAAGVLVGVLAAQGRIARAMPTRADIGPALALGAYAVLIAYGYQFITAAAGTFVFYALVLATMILASARIERRAPSGRVILGGLVALAGVGLLGLGRVAGTTPLGVLMLGGTGISWAAYSLYQRGQSDPLAGTARGFVLFALAIPLLVAAAVLAGDFRIVIDGIGLALVMGAVNTGLGYVAWTWVLAHMTREQAGVYQLIIPVIGATAGVLLLHEPLSWQLVVAGVLVVVGMGLATPKRSR